MEFVNFLEMLFSGVNIILIELVEREAVTRCTRRHPPSSADPDPPKDNDELVNRLIEGGSIRTPLTERVFRAVDRVNYFCGSSAEEYAYRDHNWRYENLYLSPPCIYADVVESLKLKPGLSFLHAGSGTGYLNTLAGLILGENGVNHGVEINRDVVQYAEEKLKEFIDTSSAIDKFEFCKPEFVVGNCLLLGTDNMLYDRVYCGSSCPSEYNMYMNNLIKVGGILVMPIDEQLVSITRTGYEKWDNKCLFAASFEPLDQPTRKEKETEVVLPKVQPRMLQDMCRSTIRTSIRHGLEAEYPHLKDRIQILPMKCDSYERESPVIEESDANNTLSRIHENMGRNHNIEAQDRNIPVVETCCSCEQLDTNNEEKAVSFSESSSSILEMDIHGNSSDQSFNEADTCGDTERKSVNESKGKEASYRWYMIIKINALPVPNLLKLFLNYFRSFD